jgi:ABC-type molybdate transport system substrate-binding protein
MKKSIGKWLVLFLLIFPGIAFAANGDKFIFLSSTIGPIDAGIVSALEDQFEKETGIRVRHVGAGTGAALEIAKKGNIDLVFTQNLWKRNSLLMVSVQQEFLSCIMILLLSGLLLILQASKDSKWQRTH